MIEQVQFTNLRALANLRLDLGRLTVLVGPNACGKSTVLDEIERLCRMTDPEGLPPGSQSHRWSAPGAVLDTTPASRLKTAHSSGPAQWVANVGRDRFQCSVDSQRDLWNYGAIAVDLWTPKLRLQVDSNSNLVNGVAPLHLPLIQHFGWRAQRLAPQRAALVEPSPVTLSPDRVDPTGFGLATVLAQLATNGTEHYLALQEHLRTIVPHFEKLQFRTLPKDGENPEARYALDLNIRGAGRIPAEMASEGTLFALLLLTVLHAPNMPRLILLDDLDHGLHLRAQYQVIRALRGIMDQHPDVQIVCTTHSPFLFEEIEPEEVRIMALDQNGHAHAKALSDHPNISRHKGVLDTGELWANLGEDWVLADVA